MTTWGRRARMARRAASARRSLPEGGRDMRRTGTPAASTTGSKNRTGRMVTTSTS